MRAGNRIFMCLLVYCLVQSTFAQSTKTTTAKDSTAQLVVKQQFLSASDYFNAAINSISALNGLIRKENYRNRISSFNNPASSDLGFNLEGQIQAALKPLLAKAKTVNQGKFSQVINSMISNHASTPLSWIGSSSLFNSIVGMVGSITVTEKKVTKEDLDSFISTAGKYFRQFEKLHLANAAFDQNTRKLNLRLAELQMDLREYIIDLVLIIDPSQERQHLKSIYLEELMLKHFDRSVIEARFSTMKRNATPVYYPADGIKAAKEVTATLQKIFLEYQTIYAQNYGEIKAILAESKMLGKDINLRQVDVSIKELEELYQDSKQADVMNLRINTLNERLKVLANTEALKKHTP